VVPRVALLTTRATIIKIGLMYLEDVLAMVEELLPLSLPPIYHQGLFDKSATNLDILPSHVITSLTTHFSMKIPLTCRLSPLQHAHLLVTSTGTQTPVLPTM
jgi:hypothetical protein